MRKIEQQMLAAVRARKAWKAGNTLVDSDAVAGDTVRIWLHGNLIAVLRDDVLKFTLAGWPTHTTRSRINALLREFIHANAGVYQDAGVQKYRGLDNWDGRTISSIEWVQA